MNMYCLLFFDPNYGMTIEDVLVQKNIFYSIAKTPDNLIEVNPIFCKTMIKVEMEAEEIFELFTVLKCSIAAIFEKTNNNFEMLEVK